MHIVRYAFHFVDSGHGWREYDKALFRALLQLGSRCHVLVRCGNVSNLGTTKEQIIRNAKAMVDSTSSTISYSEYLNLFTATTPYVLLIQGMTRHQAFETMSKLSRVEDFRGVLQLDFRENLHLAVYGYCLIHRYRVVGDELRIQHTALDIVADDERDHTMFEYWREQHLFTRVSWENVGIRTTLLDSFDSPEHESIVAETESLLGNLLEGVSNEVMLRAIDLDPRLVEALHAALNQLHRAQTSEQLAQCALSCRRFLERLADRLYPATEEKRAGRSLGPEKWRNRLWAYAADAIGSDAASNLDLRLQDVGGRIDSVSKAANSSIHRPEVQQVTITRLIVALVSLTYDLALMRPPPADLPGEAYEPAARNTIIQMLRGDKDPA